MKVKALEVSDSCYYVKEGKLYECQEYLPHPTSKLVILKAEGGATVIARVYDKADSHGVKWEIVE